MDFTPSEIRRILLEHRYLLHAEATCGKWGISRSLLRAWKREHRFEYLRGGLRELVIVALQSGKVRDPAELVTFLDHHDHAIYRAQEIRAALDALVDEGKALRHDDGWEYDVERISRERPFIF